MLEVSRHVAEMLRLVPLSARTRSAECAAAADQTMQPLIAIAVYANAIMRFERGTPVSCDNEPYIIVHPLDADRVLLRHERTGVFHQAPCTHLVRRTTAADADNQHAVDLATISSDDWAEANRRLEAIRPVLARPTRDRSVVKEAARRAAVSSATLYRWMGTYQRTGSVTSLMPHHPSGGRGKGRVAPTVDAVINNVIETEYLGPQRPSPTAVSREVIRRCREAGLPRPHSNTVRHRIRQLPECVTLRAREGDDRANDRFQPTPGSFPNASYPLGVLQIDHSPADVILVDDEHRLPIGRPLLTLGIDVYTRMVQGFFVSLEPPSSLSVGMCLLHAILPKEQWLRDRSLPFTWPCYGFPRVVHADNAREFRGMMLERAAAEHGFGIEWRPLKTPRFGGHIERLMGTVAEEMRLLPGATYSDVLDRGSYDSRATSCMTVQEYEAWLTQWITEVYHRRKHSALGMSPLQKWREGIVGSGDAPPMGLPPRVTDEPAFRLTFLPVLQKTVQKHGITIDGLRYWDDVLRPYVRMRDEEAPTHSMTFTIRRDPRDISCLFFYESAQRRYWRIPWSDRSRSPVSLWEWKDARRVVRERRLDPDDAPTVFRALGELRDRQAASVERTQGARRKAQRRREAAKHALPRAVTLDAPSTPPDTPVIAPSTPILPFSGIDLLAPGGPSST
jgi:putative transposase